MFRNLTSSYMPARRETLLAALEAEHGSAYLLRTDLSVQYVNEGFKRFARENGAPGLERGWESNFPITAYFQPPLGDLFKAKLFRVLDRGVAWNHSYECSSRGIYRKFNMHVQATAEGDGLIVVHSLSVEAAFADVPAETEALASLYTDARGLIVQCCSCGRVLQPTCETWHWAPGLVGAGRRNVSHGICSTCDVQYYG